MNKPSLLRLWARLSMLAVLAACLIFIANAPVSSTTYCNSCDLGYGSCNGVCNQAKNDCENSGQYPQSYCQSLFNQCHDACWGEYGNCLGGCEIGPFPGGGGAGSGGSGCGRGRTPCELDCRRGRQDCVAEGRTDCGEEYNSCMMACCS